VTDNNGAVFELRGDVQAVTCTTGLQREDSEHTSVRTMGTADCAEANTEYTELAPGCLLAFAQTAHPEGARSPRLNEVVMTELKLEPAVYAQQISGEVENGTAS
jgi:hypothetical protein